MKYTTGNFTSNENLHSRCNHSESGQPKVKQLAGMHLMTGGCCDACACMVSPSEARLTLSLLIDSTHLDIGSMAALLLTYSCRIASSDAFCSGLVATCTTLTMTSGGLSACQWLITAPLAACSDAYARPC